MIKDKIEIKKSLIPYSFDIALPDEIFTVTVNYNENADLFVLGLAKDGETVCDGEPVIYGIPLFQDVFNAEQYPPLEIVPIDESGEADKVTYDNFNRTVFLMINNGGEDDG